MLRATNFGNIFIPAQQLICLIYFILSAFCIFDIFGDIFILRAINLKIKHFASICDSRNSLR